MSRNLYHVKVEVMSEYIVGGANSWAMHRAEATARSPKLASQTAKAQIEDEMEDQGRSPGLQRFMGLTYDECFRYEVERVGR